MPVMVEFQSQALFAEPGNLWLRNQSAPTSISITWGIFTDQVSGLPADLLDRECRGGVQHSGFSKLSSFWMHLGFQKHHT